VTAAFELRLFCSMARAASAPKQTVDYRPVITRDEFIEWSVISGFVESPNILEADAFRVVTLSVLSTETTPVDNDCKTVSI
jgi:hypothetical protein